MINLRTPKGTVDLNPVQSITQNEVIDKVLAIFKSHNGVPIQTPAFELREILLNKYGDDSKLIYNLEDQGGDICSLRYDLTVPFSRFLSTNRISKLRRYQIGNVFRRDNPSFKTGRLREFTQADFDICGDNIPMLNDAEVLKMIYDILVSFDLKQGEEKQNFIIKINDRRLIMGFLELASIAESLHSTICSTIDKVDKLKKEELFNEFKFKGLNEEQINSIGQFIFFKGSNSETLDFLSEHCNKIDELLKEKLSISKNPIKNCFRIAVEEIYDLFKYLEIYKVTNIKIDLSLARGLDYYTGLIIEACYLNSEVGSIVGGGRYDNLCKSLSNFSVPCVGFSVGISRICALYEPVQPNFDVFVGSGYGLMLEDRLKILELLWRNNIKSETFSGKRVNFKDQMEYAKKNNFKYLVLTGENELKDEIYTIITFCDGERVDIMRSSLIEHLSEKLSKK